MDITGKITGIKYRKVFFDKLQTIPIKDFNINKIPASCYLKIGHTQYAISKWVSPKRTRSYPYERVYNTLDMSKKITVIPIIKDEGKDGDRDFIQWDTISLMSLLDVYVIIAYYHKAEKNHKYENKVTNFEFDNKYVLSKIKEIQQYHSSALHWNINALTDNLHTIIGLAKEGTERIEKQTGVALHNQKGLDHFQKRICDDVAEFMAFSRVKAKNAQSREMLTIQPKEKLSSNTKAKITITNYLGGKYYFTVDEVLFDSDSIHLIESKHSKDKILPSKGDIKDGLLKMILYSNLSEVKVNGQNKKSQAVLNITSALLKGHLHSNDDTIINRKDFFLGNSMSPENSVFIDTLFKEAEANNFIVKIGNK